MASGPFFFLADSCMALRSGFMAFPRVVPL
jgi:hypothetical protein